VDWRRASRASRRHHGVSDERREPNAMTRSGKPSSNAPRAHAGSASRIRTTGTRGSMIHSCLTVR
jgi:hypothetical protein